MRLQYMTSKAHDGINYHKSKTTVHSLLLRNSNTILLYVLWNSSYNYCSLSSSPPKMNSRRMYTTLAGSVILLSTCHKVLHHQKQNYIIHPKSKQFLIGDPVWIINFRHIGLSSPGTIKRI